MRRHGWRSPPRGGVPQLRQCPAAGSRYDSSPVATIPALAPYLLGYLAVVSFPAYLPLLMELMRDMDVNVECLATVQWGQLDGPVDMLEGGEDREWSGAPGTMAESGMLSLVQLSLIHI